MLFFTASEFTFITSYIQNWVLFLDDHYIYYCGQEFFRRNEVALIDNRRVWKAVLGCSLKNDRIIFNHFQGNLDSILKSRDIILPTKVHLVKATVFPVVMRGCESWTIKKAKRRGIGAFELWCWRRLLRVPWDARRSNQSILKEISPEYSLEGLTLKLKLQYFGHLMWRKDPNDGKDWRQGEKDMTEDEMVGSHHWLKDLSLRKLW